MLDSLDEGYKGIKLRVVVTRSSIKKKDQGRAGPGVSATLNKAQLGVSRGI